MLTLYPTGGFNEAVPRGIRAGLRIITRNCARWSNCRGPEPPALRPSVSAWLKSKRTDGRPSKEPSAVPRDVVCPSPEAGQAIGSRSQWKVGLENARAISHHSDRKLPLACPTRRHAQEAYALARGSGRNDPMGC